MKTTVHINNNLANQVREFLSCHEGEWISRDYVIDHFKRRIKDLYLPTLHSYLLEIIKEHNLQQNEEDNTIFINTAIPLKNNKNKGDAMIHNYKGLKVARDDNLVNTHLYSHYSVGRLKSLLDKSLNRLAKFEQQLPLEPHKAEFIISIIETEKIAIDRLQKEIKEKENAKTCDPFGVFNCPID